MCINMDEKNKTIESKLSTKCVQSQRSTNHNKKRKKITCWNEGLK